MRGRSGNRDDDEYRYRYTSCTPERVQLLRAERERREHNTLEQQKKAPSDFPHHVSQFPRISHTNKE
jgi:hypothetical protein